LRITLYNKQYVWVPIGIQVKYSTKALTCWIIITTLYVTFAVHTRVFSCGRRIPSMRIVNCNISIYIYISKPRAVLSESQNKSKPIKAVAHLLDEQYLLLVIPYMPIIILYWWYIKQIYARYAALQDKESQDS